MRISDYMSELGKKGGLASGKCKSRGDSEYYKRISQLAADARKKDKLVICLDKECKDECRHRKPHKYDADSCNGYGTSCPSCVIYKPKKGNK